MNTFKLYLLLPALAFSLGCSAQIKNSRTVNVRIDGDCGMCEKTIERVGTVKGESAVDWDVDTHMASVTYDSMRTDLDVVLQRVAQAGYDNERFLAPKEAYSKLPGCCQYERTMVHAPLQGKDVHSVYEHGEAFAQADHGSTTMEQNVATDLLQPVFDAYFILKDALVASDGNKAKQAASSMDEAVHGVPMEKLEHSVHMVWMVVMEGLMEPMHAMSKTTDIVAQRQAFAKLTEPMAELAKAAPRAAAVYVDHCPMYEGGADWLSTDKVIRNPFYGSKMMSCGSVKETILP